MTFDAPAPPTPGQLDVKRISAISLDLDDTLWPVWPTIERAERVLHAWLAKEAPKTAALLVEPGVLRELREATAKERSDLAHDLSALRRESIRTALRRAGEDTLRRASAASPRSTSSAARRGRGPRPR
jgi:putative hydrolase of the HAD superfamily